MLTAHEDDDDCSNKISFSVGCRYIYKARKSSLGGSNGRFPDKGFRRNTLQTVSKSEKNAGLSV